MHYRMSLEKGVAEAVGAIIAFAIISLAIIFTILNILPATMYPQPIALISSGYSSEKLILYPIETTLNVKNMGSVTAYISHIVAVDTSINKVVVDARQNTLCNISPSRIVLPGYNIAITCRTGYIPIAVVTESGRVFSIDPQLYASVVERVSWVPMVTLFGGMNITTTSELLKYLENRLLMMDGAIETSTALTLYRNTSGEIRATLNASLIIVGSSTVSGKLNILIIGRGAAGSSITAAGESIDISRIGLNRYRLKIENFTGAITIGGVQLKPGIHPCYINRTTMCTVRLDGQADRTLLYTNTTPTRRGTIGLNPYIFIGDLNNNGNTEIVFVTQDFSTGSKTSKNDVVSSIELLDVSTEPIRIVFSETGIDSSRYSTAILTVRMFFWDNSEDDISDNDNRVIIRVGLYDNTTKSFVYSTYLSYYELCRYRHVKPFSVSYVTKDFIMYIPNTGRTYYVAIELLDPYYLDVSRNLNRNDADLIVGLEYIGIVLSGR